MLHGGIRSGIRAFVRSWPRLALIQGAVLLGLSAVIGIAALVVQHAGGDIVAWITTDAAGLESRAVGFAFAIILATILLILPIQIAGVAATAIVADRATTGSRHRAVAALGEGFRRFLPIFGTVALAVLLVALALAAAPVLVAIGLLGLVVTGLVALWRRIRPDAAARWPSWRTWAFVAIPFAVLWRVGSAAVLAVPAAVLEPAGPVSAVRLGDRAARGHRWTVLAVVALSVIVALGLSVAAASLGGALWGEVGASVLGGVVQLVAVPIPIVAAVTVYRLAAGPTGRQLRGVAAAPRRTARGVSASPVVARVAVATVVALVLPLGVTLMPVSVGAAAAVGGAASPGAYVVTNAGDTTDPSALASQRASCQVSGPACTIRAALALAAQDAADGEAGITIAFAGPTHVSLVAPLSFAPDVLVPTVPAGEAPPATEPPVEQPPTEEPPTELPPAEEPAAEGHPAEDPPAEDAPAEDPPTEQLPTDEPSTETPPAAPPAPGSAITTGLLTIVGTDGVVLDGGSAVQVLSVVSEYWSLDVSSVRFINGWNSGFAGGLLAGVPHTALTNTVFEGNTASSGAGAVFARALDVESSSFIGNRASGWQASTLGGAIRATGEISIVNSTFAGNGIGDEFTPGLNRGSDVHADATMTVVNSSFVNSQGGSLRSAGGTSTVRNSIFTTDWTQGGAACSGAFVGGQNRSQEGDTTCPGTGTPYAGWPLVGARDDTGAVPVFRLTSNGNPAIGAGLDCPLTDALGVTRPQDGCDLGAVEFDASTSVSVQATASPTEFGAVTLRAVASVASGALPGGTITFTIGDDTIEPIAVSTSMVVETVVTGLDGGATYPVSAVYTPPAPWDASTAGPIDYTVQQVIVDVGLACVTADNPGCATTPWRIADTAVLDLEVTVDDGGRDGAVTIATDAAGTTILAGPVAVVDGVAVVSIPAVELGAGARDLVAIYESDDDEIAGASAVQSVHVLGSPVVEIDLAAASGVYGDADAGAATVTVTGSGPVPTGTVSALGRTATLDASGTAVLDLSRIPVSSVPVDVVASYSGDATYAAGDAAAALFRTTPATTSITIENVTPTTPTFGQSVTVQIAVQAQAPSSADPFGEVTVVLDDTTEYGPVSALSPRVDDGVSRFEVVIPAGALSGGAHEVTARFAGYNNAADSETAGSTATSVGVATTTTSLEVTPGSAAWGDEITLIAVVDASEISTLPTGDVAFTATGQTGSRTLGTVALAPCAAPNLDGCAVATLTVSAATIGIGTTAVLATFSRTGDLAASSDTVDGVTVAAATPTVGVTAPSTVTYGHVGTVDVTVSAGGVHPADGTLVSVSAVPATGDPIQLGTVSLVTGAGSLPFTTGTTLAPGAYTIVATSAATPEFAAASGSTAVTIGSAATDIDLDAISGTTVVYGRTLDVTLSVANLAGDLAPEGDVVVSWSGIEVGRVTLSSADASGTGQRTVTVVANFGAPIAIPRAFWLTASFEPATGFDASQLSADAGDEREWVTVAPLQTIIDVDATAVLGQPLEAEASVSIIGDDAGVVPGGWVTFGVIGSGLGDLGTSQPVPLVDGTASLAAAFPAGIPVTLAGTWTIRATYVKDNNPLTASESPNHTAQAFAQVAPGSSAVEVEAPSEVQFGVPFEVDVTVLGTVAPTGTVVLMYAAGGSVTGEEVPLVAGRATISATLPSLLVLGAHDLTVQYRSTGSLNSSSSAPFTVSLGRTGSTISLDTTSRSVQLYPGIVGATVQYRAEVGTAVGTPSGFVTFSRGTTTIGTATVVDGVAAISITADTVWEGDITAVFTPYDGRVASSSTTLAHRWIMAPVIVSMNTPFTPSIGVVAATTVVVQYDSASLQFLPLHLRPQRAPIGLVDVTDGAASCTVFLSAEAGTTEWASGSCNLLYSQVGARTVTATYGGDTIYAAGAADRSVTVAKGTPELTVTTPQGTIWGGLSTIPVAWEVRGPSAATTTATVTVRLGTTVVCTSASLAGSCDVAIPQFGSGVDDGDRFTLEFSGDDLWAPGSKDRTGTLVACVPVTTPTVNPVGSATIRMAPDPNCGSGTGYYSTTTVYVTATAAPEALVTAIANRGWSYPAEQTNFWDGGATASVMVTPQQTVWAGELQPFAISATTKARCVPVTFRVWGIPAGVQALNVLTWDHRSACSDDITVNSGSSITANFPVGANVRVGYQPGFVPERSTFYQWDGPTADQYAESTVFTVGLNERTFTGVFGPMCYTGGANVAQPSGGTITVNTPAPNCSNPRTGATGWVWNTPVSGELVDAAGATTRTFFDAWTGETGRVRFAPTTVRATGDGASTTVRPFTFVIQDTAFNIGATYDRCVALTTAVAGDPWGNPGTVSIGTAANCPLGSPQSSTERWYRVGTSVTLTATRTTGSPLRFLGWGGLGLTGAAALNETATVTMSQDRAALATFGTNANCRPIQISSLPAGALSLSSRYWLGTNACEPMYGSKFYDQGTAGNGIDIDAAPTSAAIEGSEIVFAWATSPPGSASGQAPSLSSLWSRTGNLSVELYGTSQIIAYACQYVAISASVTGPTGANAAGLSAANIDRASQSRLGDFVATPAADCSVGADPKSGYGGYAWLAGTQLLPIVVADPVAYRFTGWSGDVAGTGETPDAPVDLVGAGRRTTGDQYHARITANFQAICYTLNLPSDADKLEVVTAPNCPGVPASERRYLGGTAVVLHAPDKGDTLFRHWVSGTDAIDADPRWASVVMSGDRTVIPYYSSKSVGEQLSTYGGIVGDALAVTSKKFVGVASAAVSAYFKVLISKATLVASGIGYIAQGLEYLGVEGAAIDAMKNASTAMNSMITMLFAPLDCITAWSAGGSNTAIYAAQNLIGTAIVTAMASGAQQQQGAAPTSTLGQLKSKALELKAQAKPAVTAYSAITSAKKVYDAAASGDIGWESSAYEAWGSQSSLSIYSTCMADAAGGMMSGVGALAP